MSIIAKYRPSNGTEGEIFMQEFCDSCIHGDPGNEKICTIVDRTLWHDIDDKEYPIEWRYGEDGQPTCTKFKQK